MIYFGRLPPAPFKLFEGDEEFAVFPGSPLAELLFISLVFRLSTEHRLLLLLHNAIRCI